MVDAQLEPRGGVLVRSPATAPDEPDVAHLSSGGHPVLPGTSLAGAMRARARRIANTLAAGDGQAAAESFVDELFGPVLDSGGSRRTARMSRLRASEAVISGGERVVRQRVRMDRVTQGVLAGGLFEEEPHLNGRLEVRFELRNPKEGEVGLLLAVLKDILAGDLAVGGAAATGNGVLTGRATARIGGATVELDSGQPPTTDDLGVVDEHFDELQRRLAAPRVVAS